MIRFNRVEESWLDSYRVKVHSERTSYNFWLGLVGRSAGVWTVRLTRGDRQVPVYSLLFVWVLKEEPRQGTSLRKVDQL